MSSEEEDYVQRRHRADMQLLYGKPKKRRKTQTKHVVDDGALSVVCMCDECMENPTATVTRDLIKKQAIVEMLNDRFAAGWIFDQIIDFDEADTCVIYYFKRK
jgi:hypothetical protein